MGIKICHVLSKSAEYIHNWAAICENQAYWHFGLFMPPTSKKLWEHIGFGLSVRASLRLSLRQKSCMLGFEISYMDSSWKNSWRVFFFLSKLSPFLELCPFEKMRMKSNACHILRTMHVRVLKFHIWIPHGKIADPYFFSCLSFLHFWSYAPLKKSAWNLVSKISRKVFELGAWNLVRL